MSDSEDSSSEEVYHSFSEEEIEDKDEEIYGNQSNNEDDTEEDDTEEDENPLSMMSNIPKKKGKINGLFNNNISSESKRYKKRKRSRRELEELDEKARKKLDDEIEKPSIKKRKLSNGKVKKYRSIGSISTGIKMTPMKRNIRNIVAEISEEEFDGYKFSVSQDASRLILEYSEKELLKRCALSHFIASRDERVGVQHNDIIFAHLCSKNCDPSTWSKEEIIKLKLSSVKKTLEDVNNIEYKSIEEIASSDNWKKDYVVDRCLEKIDEEREIQDKVDKYLEEYECNEGEIPPRKSAIISGLSDASKELNITLRYDPKKISFDLKEEIKSENELHKLLNRNKKKRMTKRKQNNSKKNTNVNQKAKKQTPKKTLAKKDQKKLKKDQKKPKKEKTKPKKGSKRKTNQKKSATKNPVNKKPPRKTSQRNKTKQTKKEPPVFNAF